MGTDMRLGVLLILLMVATSCGGGSSTAAVVSADVARLPADPTATAQAGEVLQALGPELYLAVAEQPGNLAVSPYSVAAALAMTRAGAAGITAEEMDVVLHEGLTDDLHTSFGSLDAELATRPEADEELELSFGNAVWPQQGFEFNQAFLETLAANYGAGVRPLDYEGDAEGARLTINGWVSEQTEERIPELLGQGALNELTRLVLTNALCLKAAWDEPFAEERTEPAPFTLLDGSVVEVPTMHLGHDLDYAIGEGWQAVRLPYVGGSLAMVVAVPDAGRFAEVEGWLADGLVGEATDALQPRTVQLALPSWEYRVQLDLNDPLVQLGMPSAFGDDADFSDMADADLAISNVVHEVFISVDEEGTEAAAATAVEIAATAAEPTEPVSLVVDRPYLYWIVDEPSGALLFLGRVVNPSA